MAGGPESEFFDVVSHIDLPPSLANTKYQKTIPSHPKGRIEFKQPAQFLEADMPGGSRTTVVSTPEAEIIAGGGGFVNSGDTDKLHFVLPRLHVGVPAQLHLELAIWQLAQSDEFCRLLPHLNSTNSGIIKFTREGHLTNLQQILFFLTRITIPTTVATINHLPADNVFTRVASLANGINLEGFPRQLDYLFLSDPVASGMQHLAVLEYLLENGYQLGQVIVIAPLASYFGLTVLEKFCHRHQVEFFAGVCAALLDTWGGAKYYCPYPRRPNQVANPQIHAFIASRLGDHLHQQCIGGNWTLRFLGTAAEHASASEEELAAIGLTVSGLWSMARQITPQAAAEAGLFTALLPYSTRLLVRRQGLEP